MTENGPKVWYSLGDIFREGLLIEDPQSLAGDWRSLSFESPLESGFARQIWRYLHSDAKLETQVSVDTICGRFRLDFVVHRGG